MVLKGMQRYIYYFLKIKINFISNLRTIFAAIKVAFSIFRNRIKRESGTIRIVDFRF